MKLDVYADDQLRQVDVAADILTEGEAFFAKLDRDMDRGWQMSREFVERPTPLQRCQIVADRLLTALDTGNRTLVQLLAGYILTRQPGATGVRVDTSGEMQYTEIIADAANRRVAADARTPAADDGEPDR